MFATKYKITNLAYIETYKDDIFVPEYLTSIKGICTEIIRDQSPSCLKKLRESLIKLLINVVPVDVIMFEIVQDLTERYNNKPRLVSEFVSAASFYDVRAQNGSKGIMHLEAFIAKIMLLISDQRNKN